MLYFAYGSNLDAENWGDWCRKKGHDPASIEPLGQAWLPDYEPVFHYQSRLRKGGALDIQPRRGTATPGALFFVHDWEGLDAKEGVSGSFYRRIEVTALTDDGQAHAAVTYTVCDDRVRDFVAPGAEYSRLVSRGLARFGHSDTQYRTAAQGQQPTALPPALFAYGTLMRGQRSHELVAPRLQQTHHPAALNGASLLRIDWYPGLVLSPTGTVYGEVFEVDDIAATLAELDRYEDFGGYDDGSSLYRRSLVRIHTNAHAILAWTYVFVGDSSSLPVIESGRWSTP